MMRRCQVCHVAYPGTERFCPTDGGAIVEETAAAVGQRVGQTIDGRYLVRKLLGRGGMGEVYEADHIGLDKRVAIKFVTSDNANANAIARFRREARVASKIVHEHVVHMYDVGRSGETDYIVMEYLSGRDLKDLLAEEGKLMPARAVAIAGQMLAGLVAVHEAGILHRDIKPANVLLVTRGTDRDFVKLMDFGISKAMASAEEDNEKLTGTGNVIGTPEYIAPEVLRGRPDVDHRIDLYAVGITLYGMLAGKTPFDHTGFEQVVAAQLSTTPKRLDEVRSDISPKLADVVQKSLEKRPEDRYASAAEFRDELLASIAPVGGTEEIVLLEKPATPPPSPAADKPTIVGTKPFDLRNEAPPTIEDAPRTRALWPFAVLAIGIVGVAILVIVMLNRNDETSTTIDAPIAVIDASTIDASMYQQQVELGNANRFSNPTFALESYLGAFAIKKDVEIAWNIAMLYFEAHDKPKALEWFATFQSLTNESDVHWKLAKDRIAEVTNTWNIDAGVDAEDVGWTDSNGHFHPPKSVVTDPTPMPPETPPGGE